MQKSISMILAGFESACNETEAFREFFNTFKGEFTIELKSMGATNIEFRKGHFDVHGNYTIGTQAWYFSLSDVRTMTQISHLNLMYRKCKDYKDYTGESNRWVYIKSGMAKDMAQ